MYWCLFSRWNPRTFIFSAEKLHFLQFLTNTWTTFSCRTSLMASDWTRSFATKRNWSFVTISTFKFIISLFMALICSLGSSVFLGLFLSSTFFNTTYQLHFLTKSNVCRKLLHYGCLFCLHKLMKFTYDVAFVTLKWVSLFTEIYCVICIY